MPKNEELVEKLTQWMRQHGGDVRVVDDDTYKKLSAKSNFSECAFVSYAMGIVWERKLILHTGKARWHDLIHEAGHLFASTLGPNELEQTETDWLGWEVAMVKWLGGYFTTWVRANTWYMTEEMELGMMHSRERQSYLKDKLKQAIDSGLVSPTGEPLAVR